jgi:hypothetical protein
MAVPYSWLIASGNQHINFSLVNNNKMAADTAILFYYPPRPVLNTLQKAFPIKIAKYFEN